jgi:hypothetical protein
MKNIIASLSEASWNNKNEVVKQRELIESTWHVRFRALTLSEQQAQELARQSPLDENFRDINDGYVIRLSANSIFIHESGAWTDPGYVMVFYHDNLYYVNIALGVQLTTAIYNRTDTLSHLAKILIVLKNELGVLDERKRLLIALEGDLKHRAA